MRAAAARGCESRGAVDGPRAGTISMVVHGSFTQSARHEAARSGRFPDGLGRHLRPSNFAARVWTEASRRGFTSRRHRALDAARPAALAGLEHRKGAIAPRVQMRTSPSGIRTRSSEVRPGAPASSAQAVALSGRICAVWSGRLGCADRAWI